MSPVLKQTSLLRACVDRGHSAEVARDEKWYSLIIDSIMDSLSRTHCLSHLISALSLLITSSVTGRVFPPHRWKLLPGFWTSQLLRNKALPCNTDGIPLQHNVHACAQTYTHKTPVRLRAGQVLQTHSHDWWQPSAISTLLLWRGFHFLLAVIPPNVLAHIEFFVSVFKALRGRKSALETGMKLEMWELCGQRSGGLTDIVRFHIRRWYHSKRD